MTGPEPRPTVGASPGGQAGGIDAWPAQDTLQVASRADLATARMLSAAPTPDRDPQSLGGRRAVDGRLARVHLRGGLLTLARASLEQMAGVGALDREALADLAEARWRSGDLEGAAEAASAHLAAGGEEPMAHLIVAEEADRQGSLVDARRHAAIVQELVGTGLDRLFAGEMRSTSWPLEAVDWMDEGANGPGRWGLLAGGREVAEPRARSWRILPPPSVGSPVARPRMPLTVGGVAPRGASTERAELRHAATIELETATAELEEGDLGDALDRLALALRFDPGLAPVILSTARRAIAVAGRDHSSLVAIHRLRGDAYRAQGDEAEATDAYQESLRVLRMRANSKESQ